MGIQEIHPIEETKDVSGVGLEVAPWEWREHGFSTRLRVWHEHGAIPRQRASLVPSRSSKDVPNEGTHFGGFAGQPQTLSLEETDPSVIRPIHRIEREMSR